MSRQTDHSTLLDRFGKPKAKIDYLTIQLPASLNTNEQCRDFYQAIKGRIQTPARRGDWITIHDPCASDLQWLLDNHPEASVLGIEVAVDFTPLNGSGEVTRMIELHGWLKTRLFPQRHLSMGCVTKRRYYEARTGQVVPDAMKTQSGNETVYWTNPKAYEQVRLYVKTMDNGVTLNNQNGPSPCVRIEATLSRGGCQNAGLYRIAELPVFVNQIRRYVSPFMYVASGIRPESKRSRANTPHKAQAAIRDTDKERKRVADAWDQYGAAWAGKHGYSTVPDSRTNRLIGVALKGLRDDLMCLKLTREVAEPPDYGLVENPVNSRFVDSRSRSHIEDKSSSHSQQGERSNDRFLKAQNTDAPEKHKVCPAEIAVQTESEGTVCTSTS